jgi:hypothetical protein
MLNIVLSFYAYIFSFWSMILGCASVSDISFSPLTSNEVSED